MTSLDPRPFYRAGAVGASLQLLSLAVLVTVGIVLGPRPETAAEAFATYQDGPLHLVLRGDLVIVGLLLTPYLLTAPALFLALRRVGFAVAAFAALFTVIAVVGAIASESTFSLLHLAERYVSAASEAQRAALLAAAEAVVATDLWNASAGYFGGFLLQGAGVAFSLLMLLSDRFHRLTTWSGLLGNGSDLLQHAIHPFLPTVASAIAIGMGLVYLVWYPMLAWDFARLARVEHAPEGPRRAGTPSPATPSTAAGSPRPR
jgi:hypothetical protein